MCRALPAFADGLNASPYGNAREGGADHGSQGGIGRPGKGEQGRESPLACGVQGVQARFLEGRLRLAAFGVAAEFQKCIFRHRGEFLNGRG